MYRPQPGGGESFKVVCPANDFTTSIVYKFDLSQTKSWFLSWILEVDLWSWILDPWIWSLLWIPFCQWLVIQNFLLWLDDKVTLEIAKVCLWLSCYHWHILSKSESWIIFGCFAKYLVLYTVKDNLVWYHIWTDYFIYMMFTSHYWYTVTLSYSIYHVTPSTNINKFFIVLEERG